MNESWNLQLTLDGFIVAVVHICSVRRQLPRAALGHRLVVTLGYNVDVAELSGLLGSLLAPGACYNLQGTGILAGPVSGPVV